MSRWGVVLAVAFVIGCKARGSAPEQAAAAAHRSPQAPATSNAADARVASDPWAQPPKPNPDDPPSLLDRHRLAEEVCPAVTAPFFFRVEKAGKVSFLLGTRHIGVPFAKFPAVVHDQLRASRVVVFEIPPDDQSKAPRDKIVVSDALGPELWERYRHLVGPSADRLRKTSPATAIVMLVAMYEDLGAMLENDLEHEAGEDHVPMTGLESHAFQQRLMDQLLDVRMLRAIVQEVADRNEIEKQTRKDLASYCDGTKEGESIDAETRAAMMAAGYTDADLVAWEERLVYARNASWIPKLDAMFDAGSGVFVAVGAAHLRGPRGVPALLRAKGYAVTRVTPPKH